MVNTGACSVLHFLIRKSHDVKSCYSKLIDILLFLKCYKGLFVAKREIFKFFGKKEGLSSILKKKSASCMSSFCCSFLGWEITGSYKFELKTI